MNSCHWFYLICVVVCWIGLLVFVELNKNPGDEFDYMDDWAGSFGIIVCTHTIIVMASFMLSPIIVPLFLFYQVIKIIVKNITKLIKYHIRKEK